MLVIWLLIFIEPSDAFFPTTWRETWFGDDGISHEQQTQTAFEQLATKYFPDTKNLTSYMIAARDALSSANAHVDQDFDHSAFHCDGENFDGAQQRLTELKEKTIAALAKGDGAGARTQLGSALHTIQDFYSHSNWVEMGNLLPHPDLGRGRDIVHANFENATCSACGPTTEKDSDGCPLCTSSKTLFEELGFLTSGYVFREDSPIKSVVIPDTKCHHGTFTMKLFIPLLISGIGGMIDNAHGPVLGIVEGITLGTTMPGINKDSLNCGFSPHYYLHQAAVNISIAATMQFIDDIKLDITESQLKSLFNVGRTFSFFVDINTLLKPIRDMMGLSSIRIAQDDESTTREANEYRIATYDGRAVQVSTIPILGDFMNSMRKLTSQWRTLEQMSCVGLPLDSIMSHLQSLRDGSNLYLMTGSIATDDALAAEIVNAAFAKDITIHSFHYVDGCPNKGVLQNINGAFQHKSVYDDFASATGGSAVVVDDLSGMNEEMVQVQLEAQQKWTPPIPKLIPPGMARILTVEDDMSTWTSWVSKPPPKTIFFPVDSSISQLKVALLGKRTSLTLIDPNGDEVHAPIIPNKIVSKIEMPGGNFFTIRGPAVGNWTAVVDGAGTFTLEAFGTTGIIMAGFNMVRIAGRPAHQGFFPLKDDEQPLAKSNITAIGNLEGDFQDATWDIRTPTGASVHTNVLAPGSDKFGYASRKSFFGTMKLDRGKYIVYAKGRNSKGEEFQRAWGGRVKPK